MKTVLLNFHKKNKILPSVMPMNSAFNFSVFSKSNNSTVCDRVYFFAPENKTTRLLLVVLIFFRRDLKQQHHCIDCCFSKFSEKDLNVLSNYALNYTLLVRFRVPLSVLLSTRKDSVNINEIIAIWNKSGV